MGFQKRNHLGNWIIIIIFFLYYCYFLLHHVEKWLDSWLREAVGIRSRPSVSAVSSH